MAWKYNSSYPSIDDLRNKARRKIPRFAFEYLDGGCNEDVNLHKNTSEIRDVELSLYYLSKHKGSDLHTELFGHVSPHDPEQYSSDHDPSRMGTENPVSWNAQFCYPETVYAKGTEHEAAGIVHEPHFCRQTECR